jgi:D-3-phosphoglycerate dehydrogenase
MMKDAVERFPCYTKAEYFDLGPVNRDEFRSYIKDMETKGLDFTELPGEIYAALSDADVLQVHSAPVPKKVFQTAENLKLVISNRGGIENIDLEAATERNIPVLCNPAHNANAVAEMTIGLMIAETRNISRNNISLVRDKKWYENPPNAGHIHELRSMTIGLIGYGAIGNLVAGMLRAFGSRILVYDPFINPEIAGTGVEVIPDLDTLLKQSDIVSLHTRVNEQTKGLIGARQLALMKPTAVLINTARSALIDMGSLYEALKNRHIAGAALDVFPVEPLPPDSPLLDLENVTLTCHKGGDTVESYRQSPFMVLEQARNYFQGKPVRFWINQKQIENQKLVRR